MTYYSHQSMKHFTQHANDCLQEALKITNSLNNNVVNPYILLYSLSLGKGSIASEILKRSPLNSKKLKEIVLLHKISIQTTKNRNFKGKDMKFDKASQQIILKALNVAHQFKHTHIGTEHLLMSILIIFGKNIEKELKISAKILKKMIKQINIIFNSNNKFPEILNQLNNSSESEHQNILNKLNNSMKSNNKFNLPPNLQLGQKTSTKSILDTYCVNLSSKNAQNKIDPVIGREKEIHRISQILCRRNKNNPVLLGDPGVGKTAIIEGLAKNILNTEVPTPLLNKKIYALDLTALISGTMYRGEFEGRIKKLIDEIAQRDDVILFIDELHNIMGAGSTSGSMDVANILKPALARGQIRCIGATTYEEYKKYIEKDAALERRFQSVDINEPSAEETITIIKGVKENYEKYHRVNINDDAIYGAVNLSTKYLTNQFLPDKAIDLLDEAAANLNLKEKQNPVEKKIIKTEKNLEELQKEISKTINQEKYSKAITLQKKEKDLLKKLSKLKQEHKANLNKKIGNITLNDIIDILAQKLNVNKEEIVMSDKKILKKLAKNLKKKIIGQDKIIDTVSESIIKAKTGITDHKRPLASFVFVGPSGTGKTELAKQLAVELFGNDKALIRVDMTEFSESFNMSKLIGAPAGYVGFREENKLSDLVKKKPYSVILFDEIEKAHPQIFNLLLPVLDEGYLTDATGKKINFRNTIIVFTSNLGSKDINNQVGFNQDDNKNERQMNYQQALNNFFAPEFINRLDNILVFNSLNKENLKIITTQQLEALKKRLKQKNIHIRLSSNLKNSIVKLAKNSQQEARSIEQIIRNKIENKLAKFIMNNNKIKLNGEKTTILISYKNKEFTFTLK